MLLKKNLALISKFNSKTPFEGLADELNRAMNCYRGRYDFAVQGGVISTTIKLTDDNGNTLILPNGFIVTRAWMDILVQPVGVGANLAITALTDADLFAETAVASCTVGIHDGVPDGTAAKCLKMTSDLTVAFDLEDTNLTAGVFDFYIQGFQGKTS